MSQTQRYTFTIRDLLALTASVAVCIALAVLLVRFAQENDAVSGRNPQCKNNLGQLAKAVNSFQSRQGRYPGYQEQLAGRTVPWPVIILPEIERLDLYQEWLDPANAKPAKPFLEILVCPQDPPPRIGGPELSYVANAGIADVNNANFANGVFMDYASSDARRLSIDNIVDGTSQTLLFSENVQATTWDAPGKEATVFVWHPTTASSHLMRINGGDLSLPLSAVTARPSSRHGGGVNVAFADTHVRFLSEQIDYHVYMQLMTSNGRQSDMPAAHLNYVLDERDFQ